jgi:hypothetical protein
LCDMTARDLVSPAHVGVTHLLAVGHKGRDSSPYGPYISKKDMPGQWIRCLWCNYRDKIEFDLSLHMLEKHGGGKFADHKLLQIPVFSSYHKRTKILSGNFFARFEGAIEFRLDVAVEMAKEENRGKGVRPAIRILQERAVQRRKAREARERRGGS